MTDTEESTKIADINQVLREMYEAAESSLMETDSLYALALAKDVQRWAAGVEHEIRLWQTNSRKLTAMMVDEMNKVAQLRMEKDRNRQEVDDISMAIGSSQYMDPPDGGDVPLSEQVRRMREENERIKRELMLLTDTKVVSNGESLNKPLEDIARDILDGVAAGTRGKN